jgi:anti-sigma factor RsiW
VSCEECFERLDEYVDAEIGGRDPERAVPGMEAHLVGCPACREDHEALRALVSGGPS